MDFFDHPINKKILLGELPLKQLYPYSLEKDIFFDYEKLSKDAISFFLNNPRFFSFLFLSFRKNVEAIEKLNLSKEYYEKIKYLDISTLSNTKCSPDYLNITSTYIDSNNLIPVVTSLDKVLLYGIFAYSIDNQLNSNISNDNLISMIYAWTYLLLKAQKSEIETGNTINIRKVTKSTNLIELLLNDFQGKDAKSCVKEISAFELIKLLQLRKQREKLMSKLQNELKEGSIIAKSTEKEWFLFLQIIHDLSQKEYYVMKSIVNLLSPKDKLKSIKEYNYFLSQMEKAEYNLNGEKIYFSQLMEKVYTRFIYAKAFTQVRCKDTTPFILNNLVVELIRKPRNTINYLYISFHQFRLNPNKESAKEFTSLALNCIKGNLDGKEKNNISLDYMISDFYYTVDQFIKNKNKAIDKLSFEKLQGNMSAVLSETANIILLDDAYSNYLAEKIEKAKNTPAYQKALDDIEKGIIPKIDNSQSFKSLLEVKHDLEEREEKALAAKLVFSMNIIYMFCDAIRIMLTNNRIKLSRVDDAKKYRTKLQEIDNYLIHKVYAHLDEKEIGMLEYREKVGLDTKTLTEQEKQEEESRNSTVAEGLKDAINALVLGLESKNAEQIIEVKANIRKEIIRYPDCDNKHHFAIWLDNISSQICTALVNDCKKQTDDFRFFKEILLSSLGDTSKMLPTSAVDSLATAEMLYNKYANDDFALKGFDFSCISALYYQAFEDSYNALIWKGYAEFLNNLIVDEKSYTDILQEYRNLEITDKSAQGYLFDKNFNQRNYYIKYKNKTNPNTQVNRRCMYQSFAIIMKEIKYHSKLQGFCRYFSELTGYSNSQEMFNDVVFMNKCEEFANSIFNSSNNRNNASHGGASISVSQCKEDKNAVISDLEEVRSNSIGLIQKLLYLLQNSKQTIVLTDDN